MTAFCLNLIRLVDHFASSLVSTVGVKKHTFAQTKTIDGQVLAPATS